MDKLIKKELIEVAEQTKEYIKINPRNVNLDKIYDKETIKPIKRKYKQVYKKLNYKQSILDYIYSNVYVMSETTIDAIFRISNNCGNRDKIGVLSFASPTTAGGGWELGILAQEETLARNSTLISSLNNTLFQKEYYEPNKLKHRAIKSDKILYSKNVKFISNESLKEIEPVTVDIITAAAPKLSHKKIWESLCVNSFIKKMIYNIFLVAIDNNIDHLILGAWGCGVFGNSPEKVSQLFHDVIRENSFDVFFKTIVFSIYDSDHNTPNYNIFSKNISNDN